MRTPDEVSGMVVPVSGPAATTSRDGPPPLAARGARHATWGRRRGRPPRAAAGAVGCRLSVVPYRSRRSTAISGEHEHPQQHEVAQPQQGERQLAHVGFFTSPRRLHRHALPVQNMMRVRPMVMRVAVEQRRGRDLVALDEQAVGRAEVGRDDAVAGHADLEVAAGDAGVVDDDVRLGAASDDGDGPGEQVPLSVDVDERVPAGSARRTSPGRRCAAHASRDRTGKRPVLQLVVLVERHASPGPTNA